MAKAKKASNATAPIDPFEGMKEKPKPTGKRAQLPVVDLPKDQAEKVGKIVDIKARAKILAEELDALSADIKEIGFDIFCERSMAAKEPQTILLGGAHEERLKFTVKNSAGKLDVEAITEKIGKTLTTALITEDKSKRSLNLPVWEANMDQILRALNSKDENGVAYLSPEVLRSLFLSGGPKPTEDALKVAIAKAKDAKHLGEILRAVGFSLALGG